MQSFVLKLIQNHIVEQVLKQSIAAFEKNHFVERSQVIQSDFRSLAIRR